MNDSTTQASGTTLKGLIAVSGSASTVRPANAKPAPVKANSD